MESDLLHLAKNFTLEQSVIHLSCVTLTTIQRKILYFLLHDVYLTVPLQMQIAKTKHNDLINADVILSMSELKSAPPSPATALLISVYTIIMT